MAWIAIRCRQPDRTRHLCDRLLFRTNGEVLEVKCERCGRVSRYSIAELARMAEAADEDAGPLIVGCECEDR